MLLAFLSLIFAGELLFSLLSYSYCCWFALLLFTWFKNIKFLSFIILKFTKGKRRLLFDYDTIEGIELYEAELYFWRKS